MTEVREVVYRNRRRQPRKGAVRVLSVLDRVPGEGAGVSAGRSDLVVPKMRERGWSCPATRLLARNVALVFRARVHGQR
jgi:hypothetical protein